MTQTVNSTEVSNLKIIRDNVLIQLEAITEEHFRHNNLILPSLVKDELSTHKFVLDSKSYLPKGTVLSVGNKVDSISPGDKIILSHRVKLEDFAFFPNPKIANDFTGLILIPQHYVEAIILS